MTIKINHSTLLGILLSINYYNVALLAYYYMHKQNIFINKHKNNNNLLTQ